MPSVGSRLAPTANHPHPPSPALTEADTCRKFVLPKLYHFGWDDDQITEQKTFTDGRIVVGAGEHRRPRILYLADRNVLVDDPMAETFTPLREDNRDTYRYFGNPLYTYSLRQGIEDGFLAPYRVHRIVSTVHAVGWRPSKGELDRYGLARKPSPATSRTSSRTTAASAKPSSSASTRPAIVTTSQMLTTGVDVPTCKNIVIARVINGMTEFKQIIGRGTRIRSDYGKLFFNILDYTGSATRLFAGRDFHADPVPPLEPEPLEPRREYYVDHGSVEIGTHVVYVLDPAGKVRSLYTSAADPFDLLCHIAFNAPLRTRRERAKLLRQAKKNFFDQYSPEARQVLNDILDKYIEYDIAQFKIPDILKLPPVSNVAPSPASSPSPCRTCSAR